jgi:hypothetical protein
MAYATSDPFDRARQEMFELDALRLIRANQQGLDSSAE